MSILKKIGITLLTLFVLLVVLLLSSRFYLPSIISSLLNEQGLVVDNFVAEIPGRRSWTIKEANLRSTLGSNLIGENIVLNYSWPEILGGRLISVKIENLSYTPNLLEQTNDAPQKIPRDSALLDNIPLPSEWLDNLPMQSLLVTKGKVFFQRNTKVGIDTNNNGIDFNAEAVFDGKVLKFNGTLELNKTKFELIGKVNRANTFSLNVMPNEDVHQYNNFILLEATVSPDKIIGKGDNKISLEFIRALLPEDNSDYGFVEKLNGVVSSQLNIDLQLDHGELISNSSLTLSGELQHLDFFESLKTNQTLTVKDKISTPTLLLSKGGSLTVNNFRGQVDYEYINIGLESDISISNAPEKIIALAKEPTIKNIEQLLSDTSRIRVTSHNTKDPKSKLDAELSVQENTVTVTSLLALDDAELNFDGQLALNELEPLSFSIQPQSLFSYTPTSETQTEPIKIVFSKNLSLSIRSDQITINNTSEFITTFKEIETKVGINGQLQPLNLQASLSNSNLVVGDTALGEVLATIDLKQEVDNIHSALNVTAFGTNIIGRVDVNIENRSGEFTLDIGNLRNTKQFLSMWCTEIATGSASASGKFNLDSKPLLESELKIQNLALSALEFQVENLNYEGHWHYSDNLSSESGRITASKVDPGIVIENLDASLNYDDGKVTLPTLKANILEGKLSGNDLRWILNSDTNTLVLKLSDIDLAELVALADYDMQISGKLDALLPITVDSAGVQVIGGTLESLVPGGEIHIPIDASTVTGPQKEAFEAMKNFHYTNLSGGISGFLALNPTGLLKSNLRLVGNNPDMGRPVALNLSVEQNTYPLFQSLSVFSQVEKFGQCKR